PQVLAATLLDQLQVRQAQLDADQKNFQLAVKLDAIRLRTAVPVKGLFDYAAAFREYAEVFAHLGCHVEQQTPAAMAARLQPLPLRLVLVAALDHWAEAAIFEGGK